MLRNETSLFLNGHQRVLNPKKNIAEMAENDY